MNNMQLAERLLLKGLYPHTHDANGCNGLYYACIEGSFDTARMLLQNEVSTATVNALDKSTPLHLACRGGNSGYELLVDLLLGTRKVDVDAKDCRGMTPAMWAAQRNNYRPIAALAEFGADLDAQDSEGWTALHYAGERARGCVRAFVCSRVFPTILLNDVKSPPFYPRSTLCMATHTLRADAHLEAKL